MRFLLVLLLIISPLTACGGSSKSPKEQYCADVHSFEGSLKSLTDAAGSLDLQKTKDALNQAKSNLDKVKASAAAVNPQGRDTLTGDFNALRDSIETLGQGGGADLRANIQQVIAAVNQLSTSLKSVKQDYSCS